LAVKEDEMRHADLTDVDSLSRKFLAELELRPDLGAAQVSRTGRVEVVFPAQHPEVGNIHVWLDDEVTVGIGEHFHTHFEAYLDSSMPREEGEVQAVKNALAFISDFMQGNLILEVT
jgi:hypothetical protein